MQILNNIVDFISQFTFWQAIGTMIFVIVLAAFIYKHNLHFVFAPVGMGIIWLAKPIIAFILSWKLIGTDWAIIIALLYAVAKITSDTIRDKNIATTINEANQCVDKILARLDALETKLDRLGHRPDQQDNYDPI